MEHAKDPLHARHLQLEGKLEAVRAAGRAGRWAEYRLHFGALREGLLQQLPFAEGALRDEHAALRRHLEMLGVAAPERDPEGCLAELEQLAELMRALHAAEMALDPQPGAAEVPRLALDEAPAMDLRGLQPPEPIVRILETLERFPAAPLRVILPHEPVPLYGLLRERGFSWSGAVRADGSYELAISRA